MSGVRKEIEMQIATSHHQLKPVPTAPANLVLTVPCPVIVMSCHGGHLTVRAFHF